MAASVVRFRRGGLLVATLSALLYVTLVFAQYLTAAGLLADPWLSARPDTLPTWAIAQYTIAINLLGFFAVAVLSAWAASGPNDPEGQQLLAEALRIDPRAEMARMAFELMEGIAGEQRLAKLA